MIFWELETILGQAVPKCSPANSSPSPVCTVLQVLADPYTVPLVECRVAPSLFSYLYPCPLKCDCQSYHLRMECSLLLDSGLAYDLLWPIH